MEWPAVVGAVSAVVVPTGSVLWLLITTTTRSMLVQSNAALLADINGTYVRSAGSKLTGDEIERRLNMIDERFDTVDIKLDRITRMLGRIPPHHLMPEDGL